MTEISNGRRRLDRIRRYRRLMTGSILVGVVGFLAALQLERPLVGLAVYWVGIVGFVGIWKGASVQLYDERDASLERRASQLTMQVVAVIAILLMAVLVIVEATDAMEVPPRVVGGFLTLSGMGFLYGASYLFIRYRR